MNSRIWTIAREDFAHNLRDRLVWGGFALLFLLMVPAAWQNIRFRESARTAVSNLPGRFQPFLIVFVIAVAYAAIVGERESGTDRILLGLPGTRRDVVIGKLVSSVATVVVALVPILALLGGIIAITHGQVPLGGFVLVAGWILVYSMSWTGLVVGLSAAFTSQYRVLAAVLGTYGLFAPQAQIWYRVVRPSIGLFATGEFSDRLYQLPPEQEPWWIPYTEVLNPVVSLETTGSMLATPADSGSLVAVVGLGLFAALVLVTVAAVPLVAGYRRFDRADLSGSGWSESGGTRRDWFPGGALPVIGSLPGLRPETTADRRGAWPRWSTIAARGVRETFRSRLLWAAVFLTCLPILLTFRQTLGESSRESALDAILGLPVNFRTYVVILVVALSYRAIVGERESGTLRAILGLPATRRDVFVGKLASRLSMLLIVLVPLLGLLGAMTALEYGTLPVGAFVAMMSWVVLYAAAWTCLVMGVSAAVSSRYRVLAVVLVTYFLFSPRGFWLSIVTPLFALLFTGTPVAPRLAVAQDGTGPAWFVYSQRLDPMFTFQTTGEWLVSLGSSATAPTGAGPALFSLVTLVLFAVVPLMVGYRRFERADIG